MPGAAYFQPDIRGSELFAADGLGGILQYAGGDVWGRRKEEEGSGGSGLQGQLRYTSYSFDPVIGKYFAQARFYDAEQGRMMGKDPVKRGLNGYPYCDNDPVNYVDPTGEIANIIAGGIAGGVIGGAFGFAGSAVSQLMSGERFSMRKALGSAANGAVVGAVRGALVGSGIGIGTSLAANFIGGAVGSALEQKIGSGSVSLKESIVSGAATAGIRYLARDWDEGGSDLAGSVLGLAQGIGQMAISPYAKNRDPRRGCGVRSPLSNRVGEAMAYGYRYDVGSLQKTGGVRRKKDGFSMLGLLKEAAIGGVMGGLAGAAFYGAGKALGFLKDSIKDVRGNKGGSPTVNKPSVRTRINNLPETKAPNAIKASDVTNAWDDYLSSNTTNIHPITGKPDPNRIFSSDATRSIRLGNHEMKSFGTTKAHFHYEKWDYNAVDDIMTISNIMQRFRE